MSQNLGARLSADLRSHLDKANATSSTRAIVVCTIDEGGHAHPAMLSAQEFYVLDDSLIRLVTYPSSRTAANLRERQRVTAILADVDGVFYIKGVVSDSRPDNGRIMFDVRVVEVLEDRPATGENARLTSGIRFQRDI